MNNDNPSPAEAFRDFNESEMAKDDPKVDPKAISAIFEGIAIPLIQELINNKKIVFIKNVRQLTGLGLKEAKDIADAIFMLFKFPVPQHTSYEAIQLAQANRDVEANRREICDQDRRIDQLIDEQDRLQDILNKIYAERDNAVDIQMGLEGDLQKAAEKIVLLEKLLKSYLPNY